MSNATDYINDVFEVLIDNGFIPADDIDEPEIFTNLNPNTLPWAAKRFDALRPESFGFTAVTFNDGEVKVVAMNGVGVIHADARFDTTRLGLTMLNGALEALR